MRQSATPLRPGMPQQWCRGIDTRPHVAIKRCALADAYRSSDDGEAYLPIKRLMAYYGADLSGFHLPFNFHLISTRLAASGFRRSHRGL